MLTYPSTWGWAQIIAPQNVGGHMSRILNFTILFLLGGIIYVQTDGFGANAGSSVVRSEPVAAVQVQTVVITPAVAKVLIDDPQQPVKTADINALTKAEKDAIKSRFTAQRLAASTLIRTVKLTKTPVIVKPEIARMIVAGKIVNARSEPTTQSQVLAKLRRGTEVVPTGNSDGDWAEVIVEETGQSVWMHSDFLTQQS